MCRLVRAIFIYIPLILLLYLGLLVSAVLIVGILPAYWFGLKYFVVLGGGIGIAIIFLGTGFGVDLVMEKIREKVASRREIKEEIEKSEEPSIVRAWLKARK